MAATLLEQARSLHEDVERLERMVVKELQKDAKSHNERLAKDHRVKAMVDLMLSSTGKLLDIYEDKDGARREEIAVLGGQTATGHNNPFSAFYDRLKEIREYHRLHPNAPLQDAGDDLEQMLKDDPHVEFSGEEGQGRYLDLHGPYHRYVSSPFGKPVEYTAYLEEYSTLHKVPRESKFVKEYAEYVGELLAYLVSFFQRTKPLQDVEKVFTKLAAEFEERWAAGIVEGWEKDAAKRGSVDLDQYHSPEELMELGGPTLKDALAAMCMKTGGSIKERAERLWLTKLYPLKDLDNKHFGKGRTPAAVKELALVEYKVRRLSEMLAEAVQETKARVEKKQALTYEEIEAERQDEEMPEAEAESEEEEEEQPIYNPKNLPLDWDGKPIPYWLYKLHGLNQEFKCEICGNDSYKGPRAFERHFNEWKHQHGLRCLGIPYSRNFYNITSINDARTLWVKVQQDVDSRRPEEEEKEDRDGNVYKLKTYTDLLRQGIIEE